MEQRTRSTKWLKERKFFTVLPVLLLPFITLLFWALGGGQVKEVAAKTTVKEGMNITLPDAQLRDKEQLDKMSYYKMAAQDSAKRMEEIKNDPYYNANEDSVAKNDLSFYNEHTNKYSSEAKIYRKLSKLDSLLNETVEKPKVGDNYLSKRFQENEGTNKEDFERLEQMVQALNQSPDSDPELEQLNAMLEKILDIQHPGRVQDRAKEISENRKGQVFAVSAAGNNPVSLLDNSSSEGNENIQLSGASIGNRFYSLEENENSSDQKQNVVEAVIDETRSLTDGSIIKLRLVGDTYINGVLLRENSFIYGITSLHGERLNVKVSSIRSGNTILPVSMAVYDLDGIKGIYIPGAITRTVVKESAGQAVQGVGMTTLDASIGAQAASAGIETARNLLHKKVKLVKVTVKAGYRVLLYNDNEKMNNGK